MRQKTAAPASKLILSQLEKPAQLSSRKRQDLRRDMTELNVLRAFAGAVSDRLDRDKILEAVKDHLPQLFDYDVLTLLLDSSHPEVFIFGRGQVGPNFIRHATRVLLDAHHQVSGRLIHEKDAHVLVDGGKLSAREEKSVVVGSQINMPLVSSGENVGSISILSRRPEAFAPIDVQLFSLISYQLGAAFRNASLLKETWERAVRDSLTGLFNRRHFSERLEEEFRRAIRYKHPLSLVLLDVDHFKTVNDSYGHSIGDRVLQGVAKALEQGSRKTDVICRYGGEEFALILPETGPEEALIVAERLRKLVPSLTRAVPQLQEPTYASLGFASTWLAEPTMRVEELFDRADRALYQAKRQGRNRVCFYSPTDGRIQAMGDRVELRRAPRYLAKLPVSYTVVPDLGPRSLRGRAADVSAHGIRLVVGRPVPVGTFMVVDLGANKSQSVRVLIRIVWSRAHDDRFMVGARIASFAEGAETRYRHLLTQYGGQPLQAAPTERGIPLFKPTTRGT